MLVSELINWCNNIYEPDEDTNYEISDTKWILFFNECLSNIRPYTAIRVKATTDLVSGTSKYSLPDNVSVVHEIYRCDDTSIDDHVFTELTRVKEESVLGYDEYVLWNNIITIQEPEKDSEEGLLIYHWKQADDIEETTEEIPVKDSYILGYYALSRVELADRQMDDYAVHKNEYEDRLYNLQSKIGYDITELERGW